MAPKDAPPLFGRRLDGVRVLIVEDHQDSREMLCEFLTLLGAECEHASDVATARAKLSGSWVPDVVISDIGLPGEDGYSLSRWVRERTSPVPPPPLIAVTALDDRVATQAAGFVAHVTKPVDMPQLLAAVFEVLDSKRPNES